MVLASLLITGILVVLFGELPSIFQPTYTVHLWFPEGRGLTLDSLVRRNGIVVGRVTEIRFATGEKELRRPEGISQAEFSSGILVAAEIQKKAKLYKNDVCRIETDLLGKHWLEFLRAAGKPATAELLDASKLQKGEIAPDPLDSLSTVTKSLGELTPKVKEASGALAGAGGELKTAAERVSAVLDPATQKNIREATQLAKESLDAIHNMIGDEKTQKELKAALKQLPDSLNDINQTMEHARARLKEVEPFTKALGSKETVDQLKEATEKLNQVMGDLAVFSEALRNPQGSLGLLLQDRQLYDHLNQAAKNVDELSRRLRPILNDVRVFSDKVARHPERLGARGLLERSPGIK
jgi:phospholipid/cholesterol/gamma-HCH transport system substrate-binding protein